MAFRFDRPKRGRNPRLGADPANASGHEQEVGGPGGVTGSLSFVIHQHRAALSVGEEGRREAAGLGLMMPNSLAVRLEPDGEGGGHVSVR